MDLKEIQNLIKFVASKSVDEVEIEQKDFKITIRKNAPAEGGYHLVPQHQHYIQAPSSPAESVVNTQLTTTQPVSKEVPVIEPVSDNLIVIKSPMIGTFYRQSKPENPAFVNVGDEIKVGKVLCIIEAMKLFNEIESEVSGKIVKVLVDNNTPVEYDQPLFLVEPA
jgi:acetyl-CoA carboxylase biotin carboxyl carrier protein